MIEKLHPIEGFNKGVIVKLRLIEHLNKGVIVKLHLTEGLNGSKSVSGVHEIE